MLDIVHQDCEYDPPIGAHWDAWVGQFFDCYLKFDEKACEYMDSNSLPDTIYKAEKWLVSLQGVKQFFSPLHPSPYHAGDNSTLV